MVDGRVYHSVEEQMVDEEPLYSAAGDEQTLEARAEQTVIFPQSGL